MYHCVYVGSCVSGCVTGVGVCVYHRCLFTVVFFYVARIVWVLVACECISLIHVALVVL